MIALVSSLSGLGAAEAPTPPVGPTLNDFGHDPVWLVIVKAVLVFVLLVLLTLFNIWFERRVVARMQHRPGPNVHGPFGLLQSLADGVKLALKEDFIPKAADKVVFVLAPILVVVPAFVTFAVIPFGPEVSMFGERTPLQLTDMPVAVLFVMAIASIGIYGIVLGGWSSGSTYSLLGGLRSSAQMISYEVSMSLSLVAVFLFAGTMSTSGIVNAQAGQQVTLFGAEVTVPGWYALMLLPSFVIYVISMVGETNRAPFDLPEAEGELVGGFHTEYTSLKFALFFLAEYINMATVSAVATTLFLGGWRAPWPFSMIDGANEGYWPLLWFFSKMFVFIFVFIWLRGTLPRLRYDQFMDLGWKRLIPFSLVWVMAVAVIRMVRVEEERDVTPLLLGAALVIGTVLLLAVASLANPDRPRPAEVGERRATFPTPPMPSGGAVRGAAAPLVFGTPPTPPRAAAPAAGSDHSSRPGEEHA